MNAAILLIPFFLIRFGLLSLLQKDAVQRASYFAPMQNRGAYYIYQISNIGIFLSLFFLTIQVDTSWQFYAGFLLYLLGLVLCTIAVINFSSPNQMGMNMNGIYKYSRNPMYVAYFICFMGMVFLSKSWILFIIIIIFQVSAHWIILAEEAWCIQRFGTVYEQYMKRVRRYL